MAVIGSRVALTEFLALAEPADAYLELHDGEIVEMPGPSLRHKVLQHRIFAALQTLLGPEFQVFIEFFYTLAPGEARRADIAAVRRDRIESYPASAVFAGTPDLVVEILSPSNAAIDLAYLRRVSLGAQTEQFWVVDPFANTIECYNRAGAWSEHGSGEITFSLGGAQVTAPLSALLNPPDLP